MPPPFCGCGSKHTGLSSVRVALRSRRLKRLVVYDQTFRGRDLNAHFKDAETKIDAAVSLGHAYAIVTQAPTDFDARTRASFLRIAPAKYEYGWKMAMIGDECVVVAVKPGSDAAAKGLTPGDRRLIGAGDVATASRSTAA
jgi:hypothetical protein